MKPHILMGSFISKLLRASKVIEEMKRTTFEDHKTFSQLSPLFLETVSKVLVNCSTLFCVTSVIHYLYLQPQAMHPPERATSAWVSIRVLVCTDKDKKEIPFHFSLAIFLWKSWKDIIIFLLLIVNFIRATDQSFLLVNFRVQWKNDNIVYSDEILLNGTLIFLRKK